MKLLNYFLLLPFLFGLFQDSKSSDDDLGMENFHVSPCDSITPLFQKTIDLTFEEDVPYDVVTTPDGGKIIVGNTGGGLDISGNTNYAGEGFILKIDKLGNVEWAKSVGSQTNEPYPFTSDADEVIYQIEPTADGNYLTAGIILRSTFSQPTIQHGIFFTKISGEGDILWTKAFRGGLYSHINNLVSIPNDEFVFITTLFGGTRKLQIVKINGNGEILYKNLITSSDPDFNIAGVNLTPMNSNNLLVSGFYAGQNINSQNEVYRKGIWMKLDGNGIPLVNKVVDAKEISKGLLITYGEKINNNSFVFQGDFSSEKAEPSFIENFLLKIDSNLNIITKKSWLMSDQRHVHGYIPFKVQGSEILMALESWRRFDGRRANLDGFNLIKLDTNFNVKWNRRYGTPGNETLLDIEPSLDGSQILMTGYSSGFNAEGGGLYLINADQSGLADSCNLIPFEWNEVPFPELAFDSVELHVDTFGTVVDFDMPIRDITPIVEEICPPPLLPDAIIANLREMENCPSSIKLVIDICNLGENTLSQSIPIAVYDENPTEQPANLLLSTSLSRSLSIDDCQQMILNLPFGTEQIFVVLNDTGTVNLPYHLGSSFPQNEKRECTYLNNMDSLSLTPYIAQPINLGNDKVICEGEGIRYELLGDYSSILWHDGSSSNIYDANTSEVVSVTGIDSCGAVFRDTVIVSVSPNYLLEIDTIILEGGTYLGIQYFTDTTFTQDLTSVDGCDSIVQVSLMVDVSGVNSIVENFNYRIYPNPANDHIFIETGEVLKGKNRLLFYNALGQKVKTFELLTNVHRQTIQLENLSTGVYFLVLKGESENFGVERLVIR